MFKDWVELYKQVHDGSRAKGDMACPECGNSAIDYQYVGDMKHRIGYLDMWCSACNKGVHFSRVGIPLGAQMLSFDDPEDVFAGRIPSFEQITPAEDGGN